MTVPADVGNTSPTPVAPWAAPVDDVLASSAADPSNGLSSEVASERLARFGPNELDRTTQVPLWRRVAAQFTDPLVVLLLVAIVISLLAWSADGRDGAPLEAIVIAAIVVLNAWLGAWQESRALSAVAALQRLASSHSTVVRDGRTQQIDTLDLVPGDILVLAQGDGVGADCRLIDASMLAISEAALTGESEVVEKSVATVDRESSIADRTNMAFHGTAVTNGRGRGVVVATGMSTEIGRIARLLDEADSEATPLQRQIEWLGRTLGIAVVALAAVVVATILVTSEVDDFAGVMDAALVGVSLAVAAIPEGLPAILTIVLAVGVQRMARNRAIVKRLSSVETLGSASVICADKTGTLTRNEMSVVSAVTPSGRFERSGGDEGTTQWAMVGIADQDSADAMLELASLLEGGSIVNDATLHARDDGTWEADGDPTEVALVVAAEEFGLRDHGREWRRLAEIPFDSDRKLMSTVVEPPAAGERFEGVVMFTKGAPDVLIDRCSREQIGGVVQPLSEARRAAWLRSVDALADDALRPLAVAYRPGSPDDTSPDAESDLIMLGVVGIVDPPRPEAKRAVEEATRGGVRVVMITGDHPRTAARIARQLDIGDGDLAVTGRQIGELDDEALRTVAAERNVYARVDPEHKLRLVRALQDNGLVTAMTGDGVNDGPALKQADIGVAMGQSGTDVAKDAADMVLADDNFATIIRAIREGREIYADIKKFVRYLLASNTGEVLVVFLGVMFASQLGLQQGADGLAVPLLATQILWINLVTDGLLALALGVDPSVGDPMARPPRHAGERVVDAAMFRTIVTVGLATAIVSLIALDLELAGGLLGGSGDEASARTMAFTTLVLAQTCNALIARSDTVSSFERLFANRLLWGAIVATVAAQVMVVHLPGLNSAFDATPLSVGQWATCAGLAVAVLAVAELMKLIARAGDRTGRTETFGTGAGAREGGRWE